MKMSFCFQPHVVSPVLPLLHLTLTYCLQHEIHGAYETAVNAPITKLKPTGRTNTCLLIALTSGLWERSCDVKQTTKGLVSQFFL